MTIDLNDFPYDLIKSFDTRKGRGVVAFVGTGPSCHAGLPSWGGLIRELAYKLRLADKVKDDLDKNAFTEVADFLSKTIGEDNLNIKVADVIRDKTKRPSYLHEKIVRFNFKGIVTTNYDSLLTDADSRRYFEVPVTNRNTALIQLIQGNHKPFIFHLHGNIFDPASIILTLNSYNKITQDKSVRTALSNLFANNDILFIGFGFVDYHIRNFLTEFKDFGVTSLNVFAVVPDSELTAVRENHLAELNVTPIRLTESGGDHGVAHLSEWLDTLCDSVNQIEKSIKNPVRPRLSHANLADKIEQVISKTIYDGVLITSLKDLPNRLDLLHLCEMGLSNSEKNELLDILSPSECRKILISANSHNSDIVLRDALSYLPPEND